MLTAASLALTLLASSLDGTSAVNRDRHPRGRAASTITVGGIDRGRAFPPFSEVTTAVNRSLPPIVVAMAADPNVSPAVVRLVAEEANAIFRAAGVRFVWRDRPESPASLLVAIDNEPGPERESSTPLGWLVFENGAPTPRIHISYRNAVQYMAVSREVIGVVGAKTVAERETLLGRLMGRALAHELGHYLLATKEHTAKGLLKRAPSAQEFFSPLRSAFTLDAAECSQIAARLEKRLDLAGIVP